MEMRVSNYVIIVLFFALLCWTCCSGKLELCSNSLTGFENGTMIPATVGEPVAISFCVQWHDSDGTFNTHIKIEYNKYSKWYRISEVTKKFSINVDLYQNTAEIKLTIQEVEETDFTNVFTVGFHTVNARGLSAATVFTFQLKRADQSVSISTSANQPFSTTLSTDPVTDVTSAPSKTTPVRPQCCPGKPIGCPENWYQVDNYRCLLFIDAASGSQPWTECSKHGAIALFYSDINKIKCCLEEILDDSKPEYKEIVGLNYGYVGIRSRVKTGQQKADMLACFQSIQNFKPPSEPLFSLHECKSEVCDISDNRTGNVTVNIKFNDFILKCKAEGIPKPTVSITDESQKEINSDEPLSLADCSQPEMYTCTAKNHRGSSLSRKTIQIINPTMVTEFTASRRTWGEIRHGDEVDLKCLVGGCPKQVIIMKGEDLIAQATSFTKPFLHEIKGVNCSHMGTYRCLAKFQSGQDVEKTTELGLSRCPVSLCRSRDTTRERFAILGENITFSVCLISFEEIDKYSGNKTKMVVTFTRTSGSSFYWTANITIYGVQASDYRTHNVTIKNKFRTLVYKFTLNRKGAANTDGPTHHLAQESKINALHIALPPIGFIIIVVIIVAIVWCRVKGTWKSRSRAEEMSVCGNDNDDNGEVLYANMKATSAGRVTEVTEVQHDEETDKIQYHCQETDTQCHDQETDRLQYRQNGDTATTTDTDPGRVTSADGLVYITVVNAKKQVSMKSKRGKQTQKPDDEDDGPVVYLTLDFEKTGKIKLIEDKETKEDETAEQAETQ